MTDRRNGKRDHLVELKIDTIDAFEYENLANAKYNVQ